MSKTPSGNRVMVIDTHVHLHSEEFSSDLPSVIERAVSAKIEHVINIGTDLETSRACLALAKQYPMIYAAVGCHPHDSVSYTANPSDMRDYEEMLKDDDVVAVGEIGLDYYRDHSPRTDQKKCFEDFLDLSRRIKKPVVIHQREAFDDVLAVIKSFGQGDIAGVFHCFTGDRSMAKRVLDLGFYISIGGPVTFPKNDILRDAASFVPENRLLAETDCPYLAPQPVRGKRNEPAYVRYVVEEFARVRGIDVEKMARILRNNVTDLFGI